MSRQERKNMIEFITKNREFNSEKLMYMTDDEIEHIYKNIYYHCQEFVEDNIII
ncbi:BH0509 family protein [Calidifontibacillus erzurumensis]|uniref:BH0509 family protein n=1 Tax=Calidifontibacillus erzurumensis TaxID=2741433 RepID=A0A8J8GI00_9BACI|nr:BH0509 family protein [Calidifontibacillus erzurumensis]NSL52743.1 BH0509 family protein [Calidifontibacillus erzurumensis]